MIISNEDQHIINLVGNYFHLNEKEIRPKLTYEIKDGVIVFPIQNEIENLFIELGSDNRAIYFSELELGNNIILKYSNKNKSWCLQHK